MTMNMLKTATNTLVPTLDLANAEATGEGLAALDEACRNHGFFLLQNHGLDRAIEAMWQASEDFFKQPQASKRALKRTESSPLGYFDQEMTKRQRDLKEVFDFMRPSASGRNLNQWPDDEAFKQTLSDFFEAASRVAHRTLALVYQALAADPSDALPMGDPATSTVRLNFYPTQDPLPANERAQAGVLGNMALHHHTDPGILTLLLQDLTGGLQTLTQDQHWIDVPPQAGTIVVNLGDAMQVWSNDAYRAAIHRVTPRDRSARYSTPYFYNPKSDAVLAPITHLTQDPPHFRPFTWREYIRGRVDDNFTDLGVDDIQIDRFRIAV